MSRPAERLRAVVLLAALLAAAGCSDDPTDADAAPDTSTTTSDGPSATTTAIAPGGASAACDPARPVPDAWADAAPHTVAHDGVDRTYVVHVPEGYDPTTPAPVIFNLHGFGGNIGQQDASTGLPEAAGDRGYIVVTPQGAPLSVPGDTPTAEQAAGFEGVAFWNFFGSSGIDFGDVDAPDGFEDLAASTLGADDVGFLTSLLDDVESELCVDPARLYSTGMSNGAGMTTTLGCELGDRLAAIAPVSGVNLTGACPGDTPMPVFAIHGDADDVATYAGGTLMGFELGNPSVPDRMAAWAARNGCDPEPTTIEGQQGGRVTVTTWEGCAGGADTVLWTVTGGAHVWPRPDDANGADDEPSGFDATASILDFFDAHPPPAPPD